MKKRSLFYPIILLMIIALFIVSAGGCGSSSHKAPASSDTGGGDSGTPPRDEVEETIATKPETVLSLNAGMDSDGNGKPDFLDFTGVPQYQGDTVATSSFKAATTLADSAELSLTVPSIIWFKELRPESNPNIFSVALEEGKTYTVEFSKNFTEPLDDILPRIQIYDPENSAIDPDVLVDEDEGLEVYNAPGALYLDINAYPDEHPSVICYTFKASVSGNYIISVSDAEPSTINIDEEDEVATADDEDTYEVDTASVLFIYEERFNEAGEPGYYTNFKIADADGNVSDTVPVRDVIQLRKEFLKVNPDYFQKVYGYDMADDEFGAGETEYPINEASNDNYLGYMGLVQNKLGFVDVEEATFGDEEDFGADPYTITKKLPKLKGERSEIPATVTGIPYDDTYELGMGFAAITNLSPVGGIQAMDSFEDKLFDKVKNSTLPLTTEYYASFVSTREEAEGLTKTNLSASLSKNALGASGSTGSTNNYKFGLTSTNLVIHYEVREAKYRTLKNSDFEEILANRTLRSIKAYSQDQIAEEPKPDTISLDQYGNEEDLLDESSISAAADGEKMLDFMCSLEPDNFRQQFGDYFVCGYQYGACFDAYISISTKTSEQIKEVKQKLAVTATYNGVTASADMAKETKDVLKNSGAEVTVRIVTHGMGNKPVELELTNSTDISAMDNVFSELVTFRNTIVKNTDPADFAPIRVAMKRWRSLPSIGVAFAKKGDVGTIPISVEHATKISGFNTALVNLRAHRNFIMGVGEDITPAETLDESFAEVVGLVTHGGGNAFYSDLDAMAETLEFVHELDEKFKMLGDRYVFYQKLVKAQQAEKATYNELKDNAAKADGDKKYDYIRKMPFGTDHGGSSGYDSFAVSKYVTEDINAGKESHRQYKRTAQLGARTEWHYDHEEGKEDYLKSAGPATISADLEAGEGNKTEDAVFCKVWVNSTATSSEKDNKRELVSPAPPAVGRKEVGFEFMGGGTRNVDWNIYGKAMRMKQEDYPFTGLEK